MAFHLAGMSGQEIYDNFMTGKGGEDLSASADHVNNVKDRYRTLSDKIRSLTNDMEAVWQGPAAGAATRGAGPLAVEHELAEPELDRVQYLTGRQVGSFNDAKNQVQPIPQVPEEPSTWDNFFSGGSAGEDYEQQVGANREATSANVRAMQIYEGASQHNGENMPRQYGDMQPDSSGIEIGKPTEPGDTKGDDGTGDDPPRVSDNPTDDPPRRWTEPIVEPLVRPHGDDGPTGTSGWTPPSSGGGGGPLPPGPGQVTPPPGGGGGGLQPFPPGGPYRPGPGYPGGRGPNAPGGRPGAPGYPGGRPGVPVGSGGPGGPRGGSGGFGPGGPGGPRGTGGFGPPGPGAGMGADDGRPGAGRFGAGGPGAAGSGGAGSSGGRGMPMGGGGAGARGGEDEEHQRLSFLVEPDPDSVFGTDEITAPPVIGE